MTRFLIAAASLAFAVSSAMAQAPAGTAAGGYRPQATAGQPTGRQPGAAQALTPAQQHQLAQQRAAQQQARQQQMAQQAAGGQPAGQASTARPAAAQAPFAPLTPQQEAELTQMLLAWEGQSKKVVRLECDFTRWHYDITEAPKGVHSTWAKGEIRYAAPDKGMFKVTDLKFYKGMVDEKPNYDSIEGMFGEYWVCNGQQVLDFDRSEKVCTIQDLPPEMQGTQIFESPLPFVFNLDAKKIRERYWVRMGQTTQPGTYLIEAWPKRQEDRSQYRLVQIVIDQKTFLPQGLRMYPPNFDPVSAPGFDHYEFSNVRANSFIGGVKDFVDKFIEKPDNSWTIIRERWQPPAPNDGQGLQQAQLPGQPTRQ